MENNQFYTVQEVATFLGLTTKTVYKRAKNGSLPGVITLPGKRYNSTLFHKTVIDRWLMSPLEQFNNNSKNVQNFPNT